MPDTKRATRCASLEIARILAQFGLAPLVHQWHLMGKICVRLVITSLLVGGIAALLAKPVAAQTCEAPSKTTVDNWNEQRTIMQPVFQGAARACNAIASVAPPLQAFAHMFELVGSIFAPDESTGESEEMPALREISCQLADLPTQVARNNLLTSLHQSEAALSARRAALATRLGDKDFDAFARSLIREASVETATLTPLLTLQAAIEGALTRDGSTGRTDLCQQYVNGVRGFSFRFCAPAYMQAVKLRLATMALADPRFENVEYRRQIDEMRRVLGVLRGLTLRGVECSASYDPRWRMGAIACGDATGITSSAPIGYTNLYDFDHFAWMSPEEVVSHFQSDWLMQQAVRSAFIAHNLPIFEIDSMFHSLSKLRSTSGDLAEGYCQNPGDGSWDRVDALNPIQTGSTVCGRGAAQLVLDASRNLCLTYGAIRYPYGTSYREGELTLAACGDTNRQQLYYDREHQEITDGSGNCLVAGQQWQLDAPYPRDPAAALMAYTPLQAPRLAACPDEQNRGPQHRWTYDPVAKTVGNGYGQVLDVQWGDLRAGTPVWTWWPNGGAAQRWAAGAAAPPINYTLVSQTTIWPVALK